MLTRFTFIILVLTLTLKLGHAQKKNDDYIVKIGDEFISQDKIDLKIKQELYDEFYRVYIIRKIALEDYVKNYLIEKDADRMGQTKSQYLNNLYLRFVNEKNVKEFVKSHNVKSVPKLTRTLNYYNVESKDGAEIIIDEYKNYLVDKLVDSLKGLTTVDVYLSPPVRPKLELNIENKHLTGKINSDCIVLFISDLECIKCKKYHEIYQKIILKYQDKVRFEFLNFGSYISLCALATESAANQNKFWEMKDSLMKLEEFPSINKIQMIAENLDLNIEDFMNDLLSLEMKNRLKVQYENLSEKGIYAVPTILINGQLVFDPSSYIEIDGLIHNEVNE